MIRRRRIQVCLVARLLYGILLNRHRGHDCQRRQDLGYICMEISRSFSMIVCKFSTIVSFPKVTFDTGSPLSSRFHCSRICCSRIFVRFQFLVPHGTNSEFTDFFTFFRMIITKIAAEIFSLFAHSFLSHHFTALGNDSVGVIMV